MFSIGPRTMLSLLTLTFPPKAPLQVFTQLKRLPSYGNRASGRSERRILHVCVSLLVVKQKRKKRKKEEEKKRTGERGGRATGRVFGSTGVGEIRGGAGGADSARGHAGSHRLGWPYLWALCSWATFCVSSSRTASSRAKSYGHRSS